MNKYRINEWNGCIRRVLIGNCLAFWPEGMNVSGKDAKEKTDLFLNTWLPADDLREHQQTCKYNSFVLFFQDCWYLVAYISLFVISFLFFFFLHEQGTGKSEVELLSNLLLNALNMGGELILQLCSSLNDAWCSFHTLAFGFFIPAGQFWFEIHVKKKKNFHFPHSIEFCAIYRKQIKLQHMHKQM